MKAVIIAPTHSIGVEVARRRGLSYADTMIATEEIHLRGRNLQYVKVYMLSDSWGIRPGGYDRAMRLEQAANTRGANIEWVTH